MVTVKVGDKAVEGKAVDFEAAKEDWSIYKLSDGTTIRFKAVVTKIIRTNEVNPDGEPLYHVQWQPVFAQNVPDDLIKKKPQ
jgi:hypothetical protein